VSETVVSIAADDGIRLAGTLYLPDGDAPFAALLEALPYRKDDVTSSYAATYRRLVEAGFAVLRLDLRGTGSSQGIATDEYPDVERTDLRAVIDWLATAPWSSGHVGMFGTSYSGFNSLQMAAARGELGAAALGAVVAAYATDDRYTDDVHHCGGVLRAIDLIDYPLYMVAMNALPPVPAVFGDGWQEEWRRRIDETPAWMTEWLEHPLDGPTWRRGSIRLGPGGDGYERMSCPTMLVAGWADGYRNNTFRVVEQYGRNGLPWRMIAGPWVHQSPDRARPGPNIDDVREIVAFFDHHLRGGRRAWTANAQVYVRSPAAPEPDLPFHPGRWVDLDTWPPQGLTVRRWKSVAEGIATLAVRGDVGIAAWNSCGGTLPWGQPQDQRADDARSIICEWPVDTPAELVGHVRASLRIASDQAYGHVSVKLCDVAPDGTSALITRGMLDLTHVGCWPVDERGAAGRKPAPLTPGEWIDVVIDLEATTWTLVPGHRLRISIAGTNWPNAWPPPGPLVLSIDVASVDIELPILQAPASVHEFAPGAGPRGDDADGVTWRVEHDVLARETRVVTRYGSTYDGNHGASVSDDYRGELGVSTIDPANAWARGTARFEIRWPETSVTTAATLSVRSDHERFETEITLTVTEDGQPFAERTWTSVVPRLPE
jgi:predicted acyl esterase